MFEYFYDVYYMIYQFLTVHQNKDYHFWKLLLKVTSAKKTIFCYNIALKVHLMNFFT